MSLLHHTVKNRFYAKALSSLYLLAGLLVFAMMTLIVGEIGDDIMNGEPITLADAQLGAWVQAQRSASFVTAMRMITVLGSTAVAIGAAVVGGFYLAWKRQPYWLVTVWLAVFGGMGLNRFLKYTFQRPRPHFDDPILSLSGYSFPSGHTMIATVLYGVVAAYLVSKTERLFARTLVGVSATIVIALVGFSRIYLGAHYLSDVLGAIAEGLAWLSLCSTGVYFVWRQRNPGGK